jgi:polyisoprenoid-binding protein YceI
MKYHGTHGSSEVWIEARSNVHPIRGHADGLTVEADLDVSGGQLNLRHAPRARLELAVIRLESGNALQDMEMLRRIDAQKYPSIVAELVSVCEGRTPGTYDLDADLTLHGVTRRLPVQARWDSRGKGLSIECEFELDVRGFDVTPPPRLFGMEVYPVVGVKVRLMLEPA